MSALAYGPPGFPARIGVAVGLVAAADFLLYDQPAALSLLVFAALIGGAVLAIHPRHSTIACCCRNWRSWPPASHRWPKT